MNHSPAESPPRAAVRTTRMTPSAPMPRRRWHRAATKAPSSSPWIVPSWSGSRTKSFSVPCPFNHGKVMPSSLRGVHDFEGSADEVVGVVRQPVDARILAEQPVLSSGELARAGHGRLAGLVLRHLAAQEGQHLLVAECPARG